MAIRQIGRPTPRKAGARMSKTKKDWKKRATKAEHRVAELEASHEELGLLALKNARDVGELGRCIDAAASALAALIHRVLIDESEIHLLHLSIGNPEVVENAERAIPGHWADMGIARRAAVIEAEEWLQLNGHDDLLTGLHPRTPGDGKATGQVVAPGATDLNRTSGTANHS